ncbi:MAG: class I SAM-dependent methyltransferase [Aestuariivirga sp.]
MSHTNADQAEYWNSDTGQVWIDYEAYLDAVMNGILARLLKHANPEPGHCILDVGCGTGASVLAFADVVGARGHVTGVDISPKLLSRARTRTEKAGHMNVTLLNADAQTELFASQGFDRIVSRFGVMFFSDPTAAFSNLRKALKPGGRIAYISWAAINKNPWFSIPRDAAIARLGKPVPTDPMAPGPFAFQDLNYVSKIMTDAGFRNVEATEEHVDLSVTGSARDIAALAMKIGAAVRVMKELSASREDAAAIEGAIAEPFIPHQASVGMTVPARINVFSAQP